MSRLLVSPTNWKVPTDCVIRGSIIGGSHCDARVSLPPDFAGLLLAGIHSAYEAGAAAEALPLPAPATRAVAPTPVNPARFRNSRRSTPQRTPFGPELSFFIVALLLARGGRNPQGTGAWSCPCGPRVRERCRSGLGESRGIGSARWCGAPRIQRHRDGAPGAFSGRSA